MTAKPLSGLKVLEFSHAVMGPTAGLVLAELGAEVVKVEPLGGDHTRRLGGFAAGFFAAFNRNKKSIALDLKHPDGQAALHRIAASADILVENYAPGTMDRLGCGYEALAKTNPCLIYLALKGYLPGPYENRPALDEVVQFQSGLSYMTGPPGQPIRAGASIIDILGAVFGVVAIQAALRERDTTGQGQLVKSALFETAAFLMITHMAGFAATGIAAEPMPARRGAWAIYDVFHTSDGELFIGVTSDQQWKRFTDEFGLDELALDPRLQSNVARVEERSWLIPKLKDVIAGFLQSEVEERCERAHVSWSPVAKPQDLFSDAHLLATGGLLDVFVSRFGEGEGAIAGLPALPITFGVDGARPALERQPPRVGEHNHEILKAAGLSVEEIASLADSNVAVSSNDAAM